MCKAGEDIIKKAIVTGAMGFTGQYLVAELQQSEYIVFGIDNRIGGDTDCVDILDEQGLCAYIIDKEPDVIFHLAAIANIAFSWKEPTKTYNVNVIGTLNLLNAVRKMSKPCRLVIIGTAGQYGVTKTSLPISENMEQNAQNPYAASKMAAEELCRVYANAYQMDICYTRTFNFGGLGQGLGFLIPDVCRGIVDVEHGLAEKLKIGNTDTIRDFLDVRDVVKAYRMIAESGLSGEAYNVGSGKGVKTGDIIEMLLDMAQCDIPIIRDEKRMRKSDTPISICDNSKLKSHTNWLPTIPIEHTLRDTLLYYREKFKRDYSKCQEKQ